MKKQSMLASLVYLGFTAFVVMTLSFSVILYWGSKWSGETIFVSWQASWMFVAVGFFGLFVTLIIDAFFYGIYQQMKIEKAKTLFLFVSKTIEALNVIVFLSCADAWMKGVDCPVWLEAVTGYCLFLWFEGIFHVGVKRLVERTENKTEDTTEDETENETKKEGS